MHEAKDHGSPADTELVDVLANLYINLGEPADEATIQALTVWATLEDQEDVVEAVHLDAVDEMTEQLNGTFVEEGGVSDDEKEGSDRESTQGVGALRAALCPTFSVLRPSREGSEGVRQSGGRLLPAEGQNGDDQTKAHASKPVRQSDVKH